MSDTKLPVVTLTPSFVCCRMAPATLTLTLTAACLCYSANQFHSRHSYQLLTSHIHSNKYICLIRFYSVFKYLIASPNNPKKKCQNKHLGTFSLRAPKLETVSKSVQPASISIVISTGTTSVSCTESTCRLFLLWMLVKLRTKLTIAARDSALDPISPCIVYRRCVLLPSLRLLIS